MRLRTKILLCLRIRFLSLARNEMSVMYFYFNEKVWIGCKWWISATDPKPHYMATPAPSTCDSLRLQATQPDNNLVMLSGIRHPSLLLACYVYQLFQFCPLINEQKSFGISGSNPPSHSIVKFEKLAEINLLLWCIGMTITSICRWQLLTESTERVSTTLGRF
jgi:hypothetical protein